MKQILEAVVSSFYEGGKNSWIPDGGLNSMKTYSMYSCADWFHIRKLNVSFSYNLSDMIGRGRQMLSSEIKATFR